jgi:hypothetical protein
MRTSRVFFDNNEPQAVSAKVDRNADEARASGKRKRVDKLSIAVPMPTSAKDECVCVCVRAWAARVCVCVCTCVCVLEQTGQNQEVHRPCPRGYDQFART